MSDNITPQAISALIKSPTQTNNNVPRASLLGLPLEIREMIYDYVLDSEQEEHHEYSGVSNKNHKTDACLPLRKIRPPSLVRVCKTTRNEYLPHYFKSTCFRIYIDIQAFDLFPPDTPQAAYTYLDPAASSWLSSLRNVDTACFRNVQCRFIDSASDPLGTNFTVAYVPKTRSYVQSFKLDDGWDIARQIIEKGMAHKITRCSQRIWETLCCNPEGLSVEVLDSMRLLRLCKAFDLTHNLTSSTAHET